MSSASPPSSSSPPLNSSKSKSDGFASDANIRNFAPVARIMKTALPENAKIAKEAKECMQECVSEFISFITSEGTRQCAWSSFRSSRMNSIREMPAGKAQNGQRGGHSVRHDFTWLRELCRSAQNLPIALPRSKLPLPFSFVAENLAEDE